MKEMKCLDCEKTFKANSSEEMMNEMMPHYMEDHAEMMKSGTEEDKKIWFCSKIHCTGRLTFQLNHWVVHSRILAN